MKAEDREARFPHSIVIKLAGEDQPATLAFRTWSIDHLLRRPTVLAEHVQRAGFRLLLSNLAASKPGSGRLGSEGDQDPLCPGRIA